MKQALNILIPTDFSDGSNHAANFGIAIADKFFAKIFLLNAYMIPLIASEVPYETVYNTAEEAKEEAQQNLNRVIDNIRKNKIDFYCETILSQGNAAESIKESIKSKKIDLVIMGSKGGSTFKTAILGSVSAKTIEKAPCPVIIVPQKSKTKEIHKIIYATNLLNADIKVLQELVAFAKAFDAEITISHIAFPEERDSKKWLEIFKEDVKKVIAYKKIKYILKHESDFVEGMEKICSEEKADLIAMLTIERAPFEKLYNSSLTKKMSYHTEIPLMVFHSEEYI
jgi:nucleotide-binding universal stress UspA family protein